MVWINTGPEGDYTRCANIVDGEDCPSSSMLTSVEYISPDSSPVLFEFKNPPKKFRDMKLLPTTTGVLLVDQTDPEFTSLFPRDQISQHRAIIKIGDEAIDKYCVVRPINFATCTDFELSDVDWIPVLKAYVTWRKIVYLENCLGSLQIARERHSRKLLVSDSLREKLIAFDSEGAFFEKPENLASR